MGAEHLGNRFLEAIWLLAQLALAIACLTAISWAIFTRSPEDFLRYGGPIMLFAVLAFSAISIVATSIKYEEVDDHWWAKPRIVSSMISFVVVASLVAGVIYYSMAAAIHDIFAWATRLVVTRQSVILVGICTFLAGGALYIVRYTLRSIFGLTEILVGVSIGTLKMSSDAAINQDFYFVILTAAIYVVVRGLDNFQQGLTKEPQDRLMLWLLKRREPVEATSASSSHS